MIVKKPSKYYPKCKILAVCKADSPEFAESPKALFFFIFFYLPILSNFFFSVYSLPPSLSPSFMSVSSIYFHFCPIND